MMTIHGLSSTQVAICTGLWAAQSSDAITALMLVYGKSEVQAMQSLMLATHLDQIQDTSVANDYLRKFQSC